MLETNIPKTGAVRRKMLMGLLSSPLTLAPFLFGTTIFLSAWALDIRPDIGLLVGIAGLLSSAGVFFTQLILGGEEKAKAALEESIQEMAARRQDQLDLLEKRLCQDGDIRTESALRDLRSLSEALAKASEASMECYEAVTIVNIRADAGKLFNKCVQSLERSLDLWETSQKMLTKNARRPILTQREKTLQEVFLSIQYMGSLLVSIQDLKTGDTNKSELARIRAELDENLAVAKEAEKHLHNFELELKQMRRE